MSSDSAGTDIDRPLITRDQEAGRWKEGASGVLDDDNVPPEEGSASCLNPVAYISESFEKGRARSMTLSLVSSALGTGILTLPKAFSDCGIVLGAAITIGSAVMNFFVCKYLVVSCEATGSGSYEEVGVSLFSERVKSVIDYAQVGVLFGITTALFIVCGDTLGGVLGDLDQYVGGAAAASAASLCAPAANGAHSLR